MAHESLLLANQLCFRIYTLERELMAAYRPLLDQLGITYAQYLVLMVLWEDGEASIGRLCERLGLDTGTVSPLAKRMESAGLVVRNRQVSDERTVVVGLTDKGRALEQDALAIPGQIATCLLPSDSAMEQYSLMRAMLDDAIALVRLSRSAGESMEVR